MFTARYQRESWSEIYVIYIHARARKPSRSIRCAIFIIHCCYMFRPQAMAIFKELQTSYTNAAYVVGKWWNVHTDFCNVLLTVHLITVFVNNQLDAQFFFLYLFTTILYMFRATTCSSSGVSFVSIRSLVCVTLCRWPCGMHTTRSPTYSDICQRSYWYSWLSWWWARGCSKHVENWINKYKKKNCASSWLFTKFVHSDVYEQCEYCDVSL